jgi:transposase
MSTMVELTPAPGSEGARRATGDSGARGPVGAMDPEVAERAKRRRFTAEYKLRILRKADACKGDGDVGALLRREGLYSSQLAAWRRQRDELTKAGMKARKRGPKSKDVDPQIKRLERENARLKQRLEQAETIIDFQKKLSKLLGVPLKSPDSGGND